MMATGRDLPDANFCLESGPELALSAKIVHRIVLVARREANIRFVG